MGQKKEEERNGKEDGLEEDWVRREEYNIIYKI